MNSLETLGAAQLLAAEGQQQIIRAVSRAIARAFIRALDAVGRHLPESKATPW